MHSLTLQAPAKVNLFLKVLRKRPDGYHELHTLFERIDLCDTVRIRRIPAGIEVSTDVPITADPRDNLVHKAASLLLARAKICGGVAIHVRKRIPLAAGPGGGSSDAAATLRGIATLCRTGLTRPQLMALGARLGADVPFFLLDRPLAIGRGKGDRLTAVSCRQPRWHVIVNPGFGVSSKEAYAAYARRRPAERLTESRRNVTIARHHKRCAPSSPFETMMSNDLEAVVIRKHRLIGTIITRLAVASGSTALLSGSGPSVFCLCRTRKEAMYTRKRFLASIPAAARRGWQVFIARTQL